jgi:hypothetical protein
VVICSCQEIPRNRAVRKHSEASGRGRDPSRLIGAPSPALARSWGGLCSVGHPGLRCLRSRRPDDPRDDTDPFGRSAFIAMARYQRRSATTVALASSAGPSAPMMPKGADHARAERWHRHVIGPAVRARIARWWHSHTSSARRSGACCPVSSAARPGIVVVAHARPPPPAVRPNPARRGHPWSQAAARSERSATTKRHCSAKSLKRAAVQISEPQEAVGRYC